MSRSIWLNVKVGSGELISAQKMILSLEKSGWHIAIDGEATFLPPEDNGMFDWTVSKMSLEELFEIVKLKERKNEMVGIILTWKNSDVALQLLIQPQEMMFNFLINTRYIDERNYILDFNWYALKIIPVVNELHFIETYNFTYVF